MKLRTPLYNKNSEIYVTIENVYVDIETLQNAIKRDKLRFKQIGMRPLILETVIS